ncbi:ABC transporter substrate-binding protein [Listeria grandensis]|uniref:ABC transporter substrate-binding protein n=1 Tax=Listeria grandensis TaxID=1494963 RepID=UPI00164E0B39|nr:ABC transporter substrate-binding protein [Listeria grandensis]MBC6316953.1 ABC transporter substrate-binding protein [Listeria grandensis]
MKKKMFLVMILSSMLLVMAACGSDKSASGDSEVTLKWYMIGTPQKDNAKVMKEVNKYTQEKLGIGVDMTQIDWGDYGSRMQTMINSGENFDIAYTAAGEFVTYSQKGAFMDISPYLDKEGKKMKAELNSQLWKGVTMDDKVYGVPSNKEIGEQQVYVFNKDLVDKYKMDVSKVNSLADLGPLLKTIKENEPNITPIGGNKDFKPVTPFDYLIDSAVPLPFAVDEYNDTGKIVNFYEQPETIAILKDLNGFYKDGYVSKDIATSTDPWSYDKENWFVRIEKYQPYAESIWDKQTNGQYKVVTQPIMKTPIIKNSSVTGAIQAVSVTSKHPKEAVEFLNLLNTDPYLRNLVDKGIEGTHYTELADGSIEDLPARVENYSMPTYALGNHFILKRYSDEPKDKWEKFKEFNEESKASPGLGFYFDSKNVRTEIASITNVCNEFGPALLTGTVDPDEYMPKFKKKLNDAGMKTVMAEMQKQYDAFKKENKQ